VAAGVKRRASGRGTALPAVALAAVLFAGCGGGEGPIATFPPVSFGTGTTTAATDEAARLIEEALAAEGLEIAPPALAYRPAESPALAAAPRLVLQVVLPDDPEHGFIVVYELRDPATADAAAREQAAYVGSPIGLVQFPPDSAFVVRTVGPTVVFFSWSAASSPDERTRRIAAALETVGSGVDVPS